MDDFLLNEYLKLYNDDNYNLEIQYLKLKHNKIKPFANSVELITGKNVCLLNEKLKVSIKNNKNPKKLENHDCLKNRNKTQYKQTKCDISADFQIPENGLEIEKFKMMFRSKKSIIKIAKRYCKKYPNNTSKLQTMGKSDNFHKGKFDIKDDKKSNEFDIFADLGNQIDIEDEYNNHEILNEQIFDKENLDSISIHNNSITTINKINKKKKNIAGKLTKPKSQPNRIKIDKDKICSIKKNVKNGFKKCVIKQNNTNKNIKGIKVSKKNTKKNLTKPKKKLVKNKIKSAKGKSKKKMPQKKSI